MKLKILNILLLVSSLSIMILSLTSDKFNITVREYFYSIFEALKLPQKAESPILDDGTTVIIPITINGKSYRFLFDTGYSHSCISKSLAKNIGIKKSNLSVIGTPLQTKKEVTRATTEYLNWHIKDIKLNSQLIISDIPYLSVDNQLDGIIGQDIIIQYYWLFDFVNSTVQISSKPIEIENSPALSLEFNGGTKPKYSRRLNSNIRTEKPLPYCNILLNDTMSAIMMFDTGMHMPVIYNNKRIVYDFMLVGTKTTNFLWSYLSNCQKQDKIIISKQYITDQDTVTVESGQMIESLKLNDFGPITTLIKLDIDDFYKEKEELGISGYISANFMRRFSRMYYDPFSENIKFYKSDNDKEVVYTVEEIKDLLNIK